MTLAISLDIETLGKEPGCVILSIGAVSFDPLGSIYDEFYINISPLSSISKGFSVDSETSEWWSKDELKDARDALEPNQHDIDIALYQFQGWVEMQPGTPEIWAKPPQFDCAITERAFQMRRIVCPWEFRQPRCLRTLLSVSKFDASGINFEGVPHMALDDARHQARVVQGAIVTMGRSI